MSVAKGFLLGIIQGFTEFLPISSSGHLVVLQRVLGLDLPGITFEVVVHFGTLLAVVAVYFEDVYKMTRAFFGSWSSFGDRSTWPTLWKNPDFRLAMLIIIGTVPTVAIALIFEPLFRGFYESVRAVGVFWLITGTVLWLVTRTGVKGKGIAGIGMLDALFVGAFQGAAIAPGLSRAGLTVAAGLWAGLERRTAANFSFLLSLPAVFGALILDLPNIFSAGAGGSPAGVLLAGLAASLISGYLAIKLFLRLIGTGQLFYFALYTWAAGLLVLAVDFLAGAF